VSNRGILMGMRDQFLAEQSSDYTKTILRSVVGWVVGCLMIPIPLALSQDSPMLQFEEKTDVFILRQLIEIQNELRDLRKEMTDLRRVVDKSIETATPPEAATPVNVKLENDDPVLGNREAKVAVVEFTDYECPFCEQYHTETFPQLKKEFIDTGKVQYILRDFPLNFHTKAKGAAIAANCAGNQNAYWKMNDLLFSQQSELGEALYHKSAQFLGLNMEQFLACSKLDDQAQEVNADVTYGHQIGVNGTPTFFVGRIQNGQLVDAMEISGALGLEAFSNIIGPLLKEDET